MYMHNIQGSIAISLWLRSRIKPEMAVELLWCWLGTGKGISSPNLWRGTREQWDPTQPQVPSPSEPKNFPLLNHTTSPRARKSFPWVSTFFLLNRDNKKRKALGDMCTGCTLWKEREREMESVPALVRGERHEVCGTTSQIPNMLLSLALPQRFNRAVLGAVQCLQFPLSLANRGFALTLVSLSFSDYILLCVLRKVWWDFLLPQVNKPCSWANRTST